MRVGGTTYNSEDDGTTLCNVREYRMIFPKKLKNVNSLWRTIINTPEYQQGIETKTCHRFVTAIAWIFLHNKSNF